MLLQTTDNRISILLSERLQYTTHVAFPKFCSLQSMSSGIQSFTRGWLLYTMLYGTQTITQLRVTVGKILAATVMAAVLPLVGEALAGAGATGGITALSSTVVPAMSSAATQSAAMAGEIGGASWMNFSSPLVRNLLTQPSTQSWMARSNNLALELGPQNNGIVEATNRHVSIPGSVPELPNTNTNFGPTTVGNESNWQRLHEDNSLPREYLQDQTATQSPDMTTSPEQTKPTDETSEEPNSSFFQNLGKWDSDTPIVNNTTTRIPALSPRNMTVAEIRRF